MLVRKGPQSGRHNAPSIAVVIYLYLKRERMTTVNALQVTPPRRSGLQAHVSIESVWDNHRFVSNDWKVLKNQGGVLWVAAPNQRILDGGEAFHYDPLFDADRQLRKLIDATILAAYATWAEAVR